MDRSSSKSELFVHRLRSHHFHVSEFKVQPIKDYLDQIDEFIEDKSKALDKKIVDWQSSDVEDRYPAIDHFYEDIMNYSENFIQIKLESTLLISYSMFEYFLKDFTNYYKEYYDINISVSDLSGGNYIEKSKKYLEKVVGLDLKSLGLIWNKITFYQKIRNRIVHNNGEFGKSETELLKNINTHIDGIDFKARKILLSDKIFIFSFWNLFDDYIEGIIDQTLTKISKDSIDTLT